MSDLAYMTPTNQTELYVCGCRGDFTTTSGTTPVPMLICRKCGRRVDVVKGVPRFCDPSNYAGSFGFQWHLHRDTQIDSKSGYDFSAARLWRVTGWKRDLRGETIVEAGCGAGRFSEVLLAAGANVIAFDLSSAVEVNVANNSEKGSLTAFQGSIYEIPLKAAMWPKVLCLGVLQHTPDPEKSFRCLARLVRPGGELVVDVYKRSWQTILNPKYWVRPFLKRISHPRLHSVVSRVVPTLLPVQDALRRVIGAKLAFALVPISPADLPGLSPADRIKWSVLDTFDMYSPVHDHPQTFATVKEWYGSEGFVEVDVRPGPNGIIARGIKSEMK